MKRFITLLCVLLCVIALSIVANAEEIGFTYYMSESMGGMCISGIVGETAPETVIFPAEINGEKVVAVKNEVASDNQGSVRFDPVDLKGAKHLVISEGIERIEVFTGTENLETVVLPLSVKVIPSFGFAGAKNLKSINLEWIESIGSFAFEGCKSLQEVKFFYETKVGMNAFNLIENLTIYGVKDSPAEKYANNNGINFISISGIERNAHKLYNLGLMKGTGVTANGILLFDLERTPTRAEAITMLVRFLGKEEEALKLGKAHPFTDVPTWADGYVSYAYENGLTNGMSDTVFGAETLATPEMYMTFMLRVLGYTDSGENKDFTYENPWELDKKLGISPLDYEYKTFTRIDMVNISCSTLYKQLKNQNLCLFEKMVSDNVFTQEEFVYWMELS
ncbi:MAG: hypothetical protein E7621_07355 [Ruminococcaceae bacterium]|nr:hypothetical protein [Oscillospiraceae bacterium]